MKMTQEEKDLLIKDLCARLPYGVKVLNVTYRDPEIQTLFGRISEEEFSMRETYKQVGGEDYREVRDRVHYTGYIETIRPYLRPVSSMTEEEMDKLFDILKIDKEGKDDDWIKINDVLGIKFFFPTGKWVENVAEAYDYLNSIHIDYRGLIPMGLALEAPEGMYKTE